MSDINFTKPMTSSEAKQYGFIEPPTWDEVLSSQEYKNYHDLIQRILGTNPNQYTDKEITEFALITNSFSHKLRGPYIENAKKVGLQYKPYLDIKEKADKYLSKYKDAEKLNKRVRHELEDSIFGDKYKRIYLERNNIKNTPENINKVISDFIDTETIEYKDSYSTIKNRFINNAIDKNIANTKNTRSVFDKIIENKSIKDEAEFNNIIKSNKITNENHRYSHGLLAFDTENNLEKTVENVEKNLKTILNNPDIQISATSEIFRLGNVGVSGTAKSHGKAGFDIYTKVNKQNNERYAEFNLDNAFDILLELDGEGYYDENIVSQFNPDTIWIKDNEWSKNNIQEVIDVAKNNNINKLQIVSSSDKVNDKASFSFDSSFVLHETNVDNALEDEYIKKWLSTKLKMLDVGNETVVRYHLSKDDAIHNTDRYTIHFDDHTRASEADPDYISKWIKHNPELSEKINNNEELKGYVSELTYKQGTKILHINDETSLENFKRFYGDKEGNEIRWYNIAEDFDGIRIEGNPFSQDDKSNVDIILNSDVIENIKTYKANKYINNLRNSNDFLTSQETFDKYKDGNEFIDNYDPEGIESTELDNTDFIKFDPETLEPIEETHKLKTLDVSNKETVIRYHSSPENAIVSDISGLGNKFKIADSGKSGTWASELDQYYISKWLEYNPDWLLTDDDGKLTGYFSKLTYKDNASILHINDEDSLKNFMESFSDGKNVNWSSVAQKYDGVRIENDPFTIDKYNIKTLEYYGSTDVIFNPNAIENIETYEANEYINISHAFHDDYYDDYVPDYDEENDYDPDYDEEDYYDDYVPLEDNHNPPEDEEDFDLLKDNFEKGEDYLTEQEAFDLYKDSDEFIETGIMPDEFYIVQGLDPEEQKEAIRQLNTLKKSKPVNEIAKETQIAEDTQITIEEAINRNIDIEPSVESLKEESQEILNDIKEEIPEKTQEIEQKLTSAVKNTDNLAHKTLSNNSKIALGVAAAVAVGTIAIAGAKKVSEKDKKQEENTYNPQTKYQNYYYSNDFNENDSDIAYNITKYRYGYGNIM